MEDGGNDRGKNRAVQVPLVDECVVIEEGTIADSQGNEYTHGRAVGEERPQGSLPFPQHDIVLLPLGLNKSHELLVAVHVNNT